MLKGHFGCSMHSSVTGLILQNLAICKNLNFPNNIKSAQKGSKLRKMLSMLKTFNILPKWRNFAKSGHTVPTVGRWVGMQGLQSRFQASIRV